MISNYISVTRLLVPAYLFLSIQRNAELFFLAELKHSLSVHKKRGDTEAVTLVHNFAYNLHLNTGVEIPFLSVE